MVNDPKSNLQDFVASFVERSSGEIVESSQVLEVGVLVIIVLGSLYRPFPPVGHPKR